MNTQEIQLINFIKDIKIMYSQNGLSEISNKD